jgi:hypothetical protein
MVSSSMSPKFAELESVFVFLITIKPLVGNSLASVKVIVVASDVILPFKVVSS